MSEALKGQEEGGKWQQQPVFTLGGCAIWRRTRVPEWGGAVLHVQSWSSEWRGGPKGGAYLLCVTSYSLGQNKNWVWCSIWNEVTGREQPTRSTGGGELVPDGEERAGFD